MIRIFGAEKISIIFLRFSCQVWFYLKLFARRLIVSVVVYLIFTITLWAFELNILIEGRIHIVKVLLLWQLSHQVLRLRLKQSNKLSLIHGSHLLPFSISQLLTLILEKGSSWDFLLILGNHLRKLRKLIFNVIASFLLNNQTWFSLVATTNCQALFNVRWIFSLYQSIRERFMDWWEVKAFLIY